MRFLAAALAALLFVAGCGDGGSSVAPTGPAAALSLRWTDVPDYLTLRLDETMNFTATLSRAVDATVVITADEPGVEVSGELTRAGVFRATVTGVEAGEAAISLVATYPGYDRAAATVDLSVGGFFKLQTWRHMVFDAFKCPNQECHWLRQSVEERTTRVLPFMPNFHVVDDPSDARPEEFGRFSESEMDTLETAIRDGVEQLTGQRFTGQITSSSELRQEDGWVDVVPVTDLHYAGRPGSSRGRQAPCGTAYVGRTDGRIFLNVEALRLEYRCATRPTMMHEIGHALGFWHLRARGDSVMDVHSDDLDDFNPSEQFHARLAYQMGRDALYTSDPSGKPSGASQLRNDSEWPDDRMISCFLH